MAWDQRDQKRKMRIVVENRGTQKKRYKIHPFLAVENPVDQQQYEEPLPQDFIQALNEGSLVVDEIEFIDPPTSHIPADPNTPITTLHKGNMGVGRGVLVG